MERIKENFDIRTIKENEYVFCGLKIEIVDNPDGTFYICYSQPDFIPKIKFIDVNPDLDGKLRASDKLISEFRSLIGSLQWSANMTRPDLSYGVTSLMGKIGDLRIDDCRKANKLLRKAKGCHPSLVTCKPLDMSCLRLHIYSDAGFANLNDMGSQMGHVTFIEDSISRNVIEWKSRKIMRICRSTFSAELLACGEAMDYLIFIKEIFKEWHIQIIKMVLSIDSKGVFENINNITGETKEKALKIELARLKQVVNEGNIHIEWVPTKEIISDVLTKEMSGLVLLQAMN